jgi:hypothetical protein
MLAAVHVEYSVVPAALCKRSVAYYVVCMLLRIESDCFPKQHSATGFCNGDAMYFPNIISLNIRLQKVKRHWCPFFLIIKNCFLKQVTFTAGVRIRCASNLHPSWLTWRWRVVSLRMTGRTTSRVFRKQRARAASNPCAGWRRLHSCR